MPFADQLLHLPARIIRMWRLSKIRVVMGHAWVIYDPGSGVDIDFQKI